MGNPLFWNRIVFKDSGGALPKPEYQLLWFQRANTAPLDVRIWEFDSLHGRVLGELASRCAQLRRLDIDAIHDVDLLSSLQSPAPLLESLSISVAETHAPMAGNALLAMFAACTPRLKCLRTSGVMLFDSPTNHFTNLSHLFVEHCSSFTPEGVQSLFQLNPRLETLTLEDCSLGGSIRSSATGSGTSHGAEATNIVNLRILKDIRMNSCDVALLRTVFSRVQLSSDGLMMSWSEWRPKTVLLNEILTPDLLPHIPVLNDLRALNVGVHVDELYAMDQTSMVSLYNYTESNLRTITLDMLTGMLPLHDLQELRLQGVRNVFVDTGFRSTLAALSPRRMPSLTTLVLRRVDARSMDVLRGVIALDSDANPYPLSTLQTLVLDSPQLTWIGTYTAEWMHEAGRLVAARCKSGHRLHTLHIAIDGGREFEQSEAFEDLQRECSEAKPFVDELILDTHRSYPYFEIPKACLRKV